MNKSDLTPELREELEAEFETVISFSSGIKQLSEDYFVSGALSDTAKKIHQAELVSESTAMRNRISELENRVVELQDELFKKQENPNYPEKVKVGTVLIAIDPCIMKRSRSKGVAALIVGNEYVVHDKDSEKIYIKSEITSEPFHGFSLIDDDSYWGRYFIIKDSDLLPLTQTKEGGTPLELDFMIDNLSQNQPLYKDSGLWQVRTDDMEDVLFQQTANESFYQFITRVYQNQQPQNNF